MARALSIMAALIALLFPLGIWLGEGKLAPGWFAGLLILALLPRLIVSGQSLVNRYWVGGAILLALLSVVVSDSLPLRFYPVLVNLGFLAMFAYSLAAPPSIIEKLARRWEKDFSPSAVAYTRRVTQIWCGFFAVNGAIALYTALYASTAQWTFYNGFVAYLLMGLLFAGEYCVRIVFKRRHDSNSQSV